MDFYKIWNRSGIIWSQMGGSPETYSPSAQCVSHSGPPFMYENAPFLRIGEHLNWAAIRRLNGLPMAYVSAGLENTLKG